MTHDTSNGAQLLATAHDFGPRIVAERDAIETSRRLSKELARDLARAGFFRIFLPAAYGGLDLTPMDGIAVFEELAKADASVAWCVWNGNTHWTAAQLSPEAAHAIHDDPDVITANSTRPSGQAHIVDGGYRLDGRWSLADFLLVDPGEGVGERRQESTGREFQMEDQGCPVGCFDLVDHHVQALSRAGDPFRGIDDLVPTRGHVSGG